MWTMLERKIDSKWELVRIDNMDIVHRTGYLSMSLPIMVEFVAYMNNGHKGDIPQAILDDLDYIKKKGV